MKQFIKKGIQFVIAFICAFIALILLLTIIPINLENNYLMALFDKQKLLKEHTTPTIILVGGSNVAFGFNSQILKDSLNRPIINMGLHAGSGLKFMLDYISMYLLTGDLVVIMPEYEHFFNNKAYGESVLGPIFYIDPSIGRDFNWAQYNAVLSGTSGMIQQLISAHLQSKSVKDGYKRSGFNKFGDNTEHWELPSKPYEASKIDDFKDLNMNFLNYYAEKVAIWRANGIEVLILPPPYAQKSYSIVKDRIETLIPELESRGIGFAVSPEEFVYIESFFFDTYYHLNYSGVTIRTSRVLEIIRSCN